MTNRNKHERSKGHGQFQISDEVSNEIAINYNELNNNLRIMVTPPRFFLEMLQMELLQIVTN